MAGDDDDSQKTEEPTQRKLEEARRQGQVVMSPELRHWFVLMGALLVMAVFAPAAAARLAGLMGGFLAETGTMPTDIGALLSNLHDGAWQLLAVLGLPFGIMLVFAVAGTMLQTGPMVSSANLKPKFSKINPLSGLKRQFSMRAVVDLLKGLAKIGVVAGVAYLVVRPELAGIGNTTTLAPADLLHWIWRVSLKLMGAVVAVMTFVAGLDYLYQRLSFMKQQRMSKQELKEEFKQSEGDPMVKQRLRQIRLDRSRRRMMAAVPEADVVITNPTHFAVAMTYDAAGGGAPKVVAKGVDTLARRIRELAASHDISIVENPPLARALYASVEVDQEIPPEHYKAVAEIISYVYRLRGRTLPARAVD